MRLLQGGSRGQTQLCLSGSMGPVQLVPIPTDLERPCGFGPSRGASCRVCILVGTRSQTLAFSLGGDPSFCPGGRSSCLFPPGAIPHFSALPRGADQILQSLQVPRVNFQTSFGFIFGFFFPFGSPESTTREQGGRAGEGRSGKGGFGAGNSDMDTINGTCGSCTQSALCVPHKGWVRSVCKQHRDQQIAGIMESPPGKAEKGEGLGIGSVTTVKWRPPQGPGGAFGERLQETRALREQGKGSPGSLLPGMSFSKGNQAGFGCGSRDKDVLTQEPELPKGFGVLPSDVWEWGVPHSWLRTFPKGLWQVLSPPSSFLLGNPGFSWIPLDLAVETGKGNPAKLRLVLALILAQGVQKRSFGGRVGSGIFGAWESGSLRE